MARDLYEVRAENPRDLEPELELLALLCSRRWVKTAFVVAERSHGHDFKVEGLAEGANLTGSEELVGGGGTAGEGGGEVEEVFVEDLDA